MGQMACAISLGMFVRTDQVAALAMEASHQALS